MTRDQVIFLLVEGLVLLTAGLGVLGWKYLVSRAESAGAEPSARALEQVRSELARLTHATGLYVQRQHQVYATVYRALRFSRDQLANVMEPATLYYDLRGLTADEMDKRMKKQGFCEPSRRKVLAGWGDDEDERTVGLHTLQSETPQMYWDVGARHITKATNAYLGKLLYFSDDGPKAMEAVLGALRHYAAATEYGGSGVKSDELKRRRAAMDEAMDRVYALLRKELKEPGA
jgi:hypothetical protein